MKNMDRILRERVERCIAEIRQPVFKGPVSPAVELSWMLTEIAEAFIRLSPPGKQRSSPWSLAKAMVACRGEGIACGGRAELPFSTWKIHRYQREPFQIQIIVPFDDIECPVITGDLSGGYHHSARALSELDMAMPMIVAYLRGALMERKKALRIWLIEEVTRKALEGYSDFTPSSILR